jgi:hypothetical protein
MKVMDILSITTSGLSSGSQGVDMGVMRCGRGNCSHVLCDRYSRKYGYICWECFEELVASHLEVADFMNSEKSDAPEDSREYYEKIFPE